MKSDAYINGSAGAKNDVWDSLRTFIFSRFATRLSSVVDSSPPSSRNKTSSFCLLFTGVKSNVGSFALLAVGEFALRKWEGTDSESVWGPKSRSSWIGGLVSFWKGDEGEYGLMRVSEG